MQYSMTPRTGLALAASCGDETKTTKSEIRLRLSHSLSEQQKSVKLTIGAKLCVRFLGLVEKLYVFEAFPMADLLATPDKQVRWLKIADVDVKTLQTQTGELIKPALKVTRETSGFRTFFTASILTLGSKELAQIVLEFSPTEAAQLPGFDFQTQLPIVSFSAVYNGLSLSSSTDSVTTVGLPRDPVAQLKHACSFWEWFLTFFRGPNPTCY
ncbi:MAG: hypothetical protein EOP05_21985 [Proteobacteria bacterium]|nr:MAG: hypothetical protein EOP05_21985 [Pseudomonadota bacterium]